MATGFDDITLKPAGKATIKLPKKFGSSDAKGSVVEFQSNNPDGEKTFYLELFNKKGSAELLAKATSKNFLKYVSGDLYDGSIFHRSVAGFVLQGGGFSAPVVPSSEGGMLEPISDFGTVDNQPGNFNVKGTVAMAKIGGEPNSATNQWFINLNDNKDLDSQNQGFTVFGKVLGSGMDVVEDLASAPVFNFGGVVSQLPLWNSPDEELGIRPEDYVTIDVARKLSAKKQPFSLSVESSDEDLLTASVTKKQRIKLKAVSGASGTAEVNVRSVSLVDGTVNEDSFDVLIGASPSMRQQSDRSRRKVIDVLVDGGSYETPFYKFYDESGTEIVNFKIKPKRKYRFSRLEEAITHPFYISDAGFNEMSSEFVKIKGDGSFDDGIIGSESFTFKVKKKYRSNFKQNGRLDYFCTSHPSMYSSFVIKGALSADTLDPLLDEALVSID